LKIFSIFAFLLTVLCRSASCHQGVNIQNQLTEDSLNIIEKVYLHVDRDIYYPGDDIWFKAYLLEASERLLSDHSNNLHVELISPGSEIISKRTVRIYKGLGNGDFVLPDTLPSGQYYLRAYTNYMRNWGNQLFFRRNILIINPKDAGKLISDSTDYLRDKLDISFFPEGGSLVASVPSVVAFKAENGLGEGCEISGEIYSSTGEIVSTLKSTHNGMGTFVLSPDPGQKYYAVVKNAKGVSSRYELPASFLTGVVLNITRDNNKELAVTIRTNQTTFAQISGEILTLKVSARNVFLKKAEFRIESLANRFILPVDDLPVGIVAMTLSVEDETPLCERLVYIQNNEECKVKVETDKAVYNQRDSVSVKISLKADSLIPQDAFLSFSATKIISSESFPLFPSTISSWFLLESDVHGPVEKPSYYFDPSNPYMMKDLDLLLLTQGWRDFKWKYKNVFFPPETGFTISGRVRRKFSDVALKDCRVNIGIFSVGNPIITTVPADTSGRFRLEGVDLTGSAKLIASAVSKKNNLKGWLIMDTIKYYPEKLTKILSPTKVFENKVQFGNEDQLAIENITSPGTIHKFIQYAEIKNSISKQFKLSDTINPGEVTITARKFDEAGSASARTRHYLNAIPDATLIVSPQLEKYGTTRQIFKKSPFFFMHMIERPIFVIDGIKVPGEMFFTFPISSVERFDILDTWAKTAYFGPNQENPIYQIKPATGVYSITTRSNGSLLHDVPDLHSVQINISGYDEPRIFYSPKHNTTLQSDYKPDLRTTLLWEPNIKMGNKKDFFLNYFNADFPSKVIVTIEGITSTGIPVTATTEYEVK